VPDLVKLATIDLRPLRHRDFRLLFWGRLVSFLGSQVTYVAVPYQVYQLTHSPLLVGLLGVAELVPVLVLSMLGGAIADARDRRTVVLATEVASAVLSGLLLVNALLPRADRGWCAQCAARDIRPAARTSRRRNLDCHGRTARHVRGGPRQFRRIAGRIVGHARDAAPEWYRPTQPAGRARGIGLRTSATGVDPHLCGIFRMAIWNQTVPDELRGRLASIEMVSYMSGPALGNTESGLLAGLFSVPVSVVSGGVLCVLGCAICGLLLPAFRAYDAEA
jgi:MFS family permease